MEHLYSLESLGSRQNSNYGHGFDRTANRAAQGSSSDSDYEHHNIDRAQLYPPGEALAQDTTIRQQNSYQPIHIWSTSEDAKV